MRGNKVKLFAFQKILPLKPRVEANSIYLEYEYCLLNEEVE